MLLVTTIAIRTNLVWAAISWLLLLAYGLRYGTAKGAIREAAISMLGFVLLAIVTMPVMVLPLILSNMVPILEHDLSNQESLLLLLAWFHGDS